MHVQWDIVVQALSMLPSVRDIRDAHVECIPSGRGSGHLPWASATSYSYLFRANNEHYLGASQVGLHVEVSVLDREGDTCVLALWCTGASVTRKSRTRHVRYDLKFN